MYTIQVTYQTGNSFGSEVVTDTINLVWKDKTLARKALQHIKEHHDFFRYECEDHYNISHKDWSKLKQRFEWFKRAQEVNSYSNKEAREYAEYLCAAECDDGEWRSIPVDMWTGYFERLIEAEVIAFDPEADQDRVRF